jgi:tetratricopeptide (TPR) repeat protein
MQRTRLIGIISALVAILLVAAPGVGLTQSLKEAEALHRKITELSKTRKYAAAVPLAQRALSIRERRLGPNHRDVAESLDDLASLYQELSRYGDAEPLFKRSLAIREKAFGPVSSDVAISLNNLAALYGSQGRYSDAEPLYKRSLGVQERVLGPNHPDVATSLGTLASLYRDQGRYTDAEPLYKRSLRIAERAFGPDHPYVGTLLNNLALLYQKQGRYGDAEPLYKRSLAIQERGLGRDHPYVGTLLNNLALLYEEQGRYGDAESLYQQSLAIQERALGPDHPNVASSLNNLAEVYRAQGRYVDAEPLYRRSLTIREKVLPPYHPHVATSMNNLALVYVSQGRYADAEPLYKRSLAIQENALGPNHPEIADSLHNLAALYKAQGRYAYAEPLIKRSLMIDEKAFGPHHPKVATSLNTLAVLYQAQGRYADAEPLYKRSLTIRESALGYNHPAVASSLNNLAGLYQDQNRYADAAPLYKRSLMIFEKAFGPDHPSGAYTLNNLAGLYKQQDRYEDAELLYKRALMIEEKALGSDHPELATALNNLAGLYQDQDRYADAEPLYKRALMIDEKALGSDHPKLATTLNNLATLYRDQGRYANAEPLYQRSLAIQETALGSDHPKVALVLVNLASLYLVQGRYANALPLIRTAAQNGFDEKNTHLAILESGLNKSLIPKAEVLAESYEVVQRAISSAASTAINQLSVRFAAGNDELARLIRREQDLSAENASLDNLLINASAKEPSKRNAVAEQEIRDRLKSIATDRAEIQAALYRRFPDFAALSKPAPTSLRDTQGVLGEDEALVIFDFGRKSYLWIVTRTDTDWLGAKVTAKELSEQVKTLRSSLTFNVDKPFDAQLAFKIYSETFGAIADKLQGKTRLSVVTNGPLTSLPLQLLVTKDPSGKSLKDLDWLVRSYAITNLPSVASLKTLRSKSAISSAVKPMIAFADPIFSNQSAQAVGFLRSLSNFYEGGRPDLVSLAKALPQLPETANEVRAISEVLKAGKNDLKFGVFASETTVKRTRLEQYRIVYFATHGLVAGEVEKFAKVKAEPALALTIPEKPTELDDGLLTASEVAQLKLNADWVVLSACNTAAEGNPGAEALSGLARAFFYAGARSLVVSHWEVDSDATVQLMKGTFDAVARDPKLSHAEALRESMLSMIDNATSDDDAHPRIWAPFVVVGEPAKTK